jgi:hypothetical protein
MNKITAIMEADADGTLHLRLPPELRHGKVEVTVTLKAVNGSLSPVLRATPGMLLRRKEAFLKLRELGGLRGVIPEPLVWQREQRKDSHQDGRD